MTKEQAKQILIQLVNQLKLTRQEYETLMTAIATLSNSELKEAK